MKKLFFLSVITGSILSWIFFIFLTIFAFSPWGLIKSIDQYFLPSYSIEFSELESTGNALNRNLKFFNFIIFYNEKILLQTKELELGLSFKPQKYFNFLNINNIAIRNGYFDFSNIQNTNSSSRFLIANLTLALFPFHLKLYDTVASIVVISGIIYLVPSLNVNEFW